MRRVNFRDADEVTGHLDGDFVGWSVDLPNDDGCYRYTFRTSSNLEEGVRAVSVFPVGLRKVHVERNWEATEVWFVEDGVELWAYEQTGEIIVNQPLSLDACYEIVSEITSQLRPARLSDILPYFSLENVRKYGHKSSFALGNFPMSVYIPLRAALESRGIEIYAPSKPDEVKLPVVFHVDDNWMIADDFELEILTVKNEPR